MADEQTDDRTYLVVYNDEQQYSVWWADQPLPAGWHAEGTEGSRDACLAHIGEIWTDMRPLSLRQRMQESVDA